MVRHRQWRFLERERVDIPSDPARCIYGNVSSASQPYYSDLLQRSSKRASRTELPGNPHVYANFRQTIAADSTFRLFI